MENLTQEIKFEQQFESILHLTRDGHKEQRFYEQVYYRQGSGETITFTNVTIRKLYNFDMHDIFHTLPISNMKLTKNNTKS